MDTEVFSEGYVKFPRKFIGSCIWTEGLWMVYSWCTMKARHQNGHVGLQVGRGQTIVTLEPGQFVYGREKAAIELNMKPSTVRNRMAKLEKLGFLDIKKDSHYSVVTVCDYESYQNGSNYEGQQIGQPKDNQRTTKGQPKDTNNNVKNVNNGKNANNRGSVRGKKKREYTADFLIFWDTYPKKVGKGAAFDAWQKINIDPEKAEKIFLAIKQQRQTAAWLKEGGQFIPHPATWLNQERWEDSPAVTLTRPRKYHLCNNCNKMIYEGEGMKAMGVYFCNQECFEKS